MVLAGNAVLGGRPLRDASVEPHLHLIVKPAIQEHSGNPAVLASKHQGYN